MGGGWGQTIDQLQILNIRPQICNTFLNSLFVISVHQNFFLIVCQNNYWKKIPMDFVLSHKYKHFSTKRNMVSQGLLTHTNSCQKHGFSF